MTEKPLQPETAKGLTGVGLIGSAIWLMLLASYALVSWRDVVGLSPNEIGDFLAGAFAPLAFFWLVLGFFQQGSELKNSSRALWLQGEELRASVEEQRALVEVTTKQFELETERLASERETLAREEFRRSQAAEPVFDFALGTSTTSAGMLESIECYIANHGAACTGFIAASSVAGPVSRQSRVKSGEIIEFALMGHYLRPATYTLSYVNQHLVPGAVRYLLEETPDGRQLRRIEG